MPDSSIFKGGIQGIQIGIDRTSPQTAREPQFKWVIRRAELEGGEPDMMVAIHQPGMTICSAEPSTSSGWYLDAMSW